MFWFGKRLEKACRLHTDAIEVKGLAGSWLFSIYESVAKEKIVSIKEISKLIMTFSNPFIDTPVSTSVLLSYNMLKHICCINDACLTEILYKYHIQPKEKSIYCLKKRMEANA